MKKKQNLNQNLTANPKCIIANYKLQKVMSYINFIFNIKVCYPNKMSMLSSIVSKL